MGEILHRDTWGQNWALCAAWKNCTARRSNWIVPNKRTCMVNWASVYLTDHDATEHICYSNEFSKWLLGFNCEYWKFQLCCLAGIG